MYCILNATFLLLFVKLLPFLVGSELMMAGFSASRLQHVTTVLVVSNTLPLCQLSPTRHHCASCLQHVTTEPRKTMEMHCDL